MRTAANPPGIRKSKRGARLPAGRGPTVLALAAAAAAAIVLGACATGRTYRIGEKEMAAQNYDRAVLLFSRAVASKPESTR